MTSSYSQLSHELCIDILLCKVNIFIKENKILFDCLAIIVGVDLNKELSYSITPEYLYSSNSDYNI